MTCLIYPSNAYQMHYIDSINMNVHERVKVTFFLIE